MFSLLFSDPNECGVSVTKPRARNVRGNKATSGVWPWQIHIFWDGKNERATYEYKSFDTSKTSVQTG